MRWKTTSFLPYMEHLLMGLYMQWDSLEIGKVGFTLYHPGPSFRFRHRCHMFLARACFSIKPMRQQYTFVTLGLVQLLVIPAVLSSFFLPLRNEKTKYPGKVEDSDTAKV